jgi:DNA-binding response OmpR family regulator
MKSIVIVEDEVDLAELLQEHLESRGFRVGVAFDGKAGLSRILDDLPDVVLTDIMMPLMDGLEMLAELKERPATAAIPVIVMSAIDPSHPHPKLRKPFRLDELDDEIDRALGEGTGAGGA